MPTTRVLEFQPLRCSVRESRPRIGYTEEQKAREASLLPGFLLDGHHQNKEAV